MLFTQKRFSPPHSLQCCWYDTLITDTLSHGAPCGYLRKMYEASQLSTAKRIIYSVNPVMAKTHLPVITISIRVQMFHTEMDNWPGYVLLALNEQRTK